MPRPSVWRQMGTGEAPIPATPIALRRQPSRLVLLAAFPARVASTVGTGRAGAELDSGPGQR
jgi:hypothetical protein